MFSTSGYFRGVTCPYFSSGLCERPYCHFRHIRTEEKVPEVTSYQNFLIDARQPNNASTTNKSTISDGSKPSSSLLFMVGDAIKQVQRDIDHDGNIVQGNKYGLDDNDVRGPRTNATPVGIDKYTTGARVEKYKLNSNSAKYGLNKATVADTGQANRRDQSAPADYGFGPSATTMEKMAVPIVPEYNPAPALPQYNPTPIHILKKQKQLQAGGKQRSRNKYTLTTDDMVSEMEYNPATNYSATSQNTNSMKRSASLGTGMDEMIKKARMTTYTPTTVIPDDDDGEFGNINAAFSDDDDDDCGQSAAFNTVYEVSDSEDDQVLETEKQMKLSVDKDSFEKDQKSHSKKKKVPTATLR